MDTIVDIGYILDNVPILILENIYGYYNINWMAAMKQVHHLRCLFFLKLREDQFESPDPNLSNNQPSKGKDAKTSPDISWVFHGLQVWGRVE